MYIVARIMVGCGVSGLLLRLRLQSLSLTLRESHLVIWLLTFHIHFISDVLCVGHLVTYDDVVYLCAVI